MHSAAPRFAVLVCVGPKNEELDRVADLLDSVASFESGPAYFVMVDDGRGDRRLVQRFRFPMNLSPVSLVLDRSGTRGRYLLAKGICGAVLTGLDWIARHAEDARFVVKLDTDALVIAPFARRIMEFFSGAADVGMIGAFDRTPNGTSRDFSRNAGIMRRLHRPPVEFRSPGALVRWLSERLLGGPNAQIVKHISLAVRQGYCYGEHCLGGAYALSQEVLRRMLKGGMLDVASRWMAIDCPEDVMMGMYVRAVGLRLANCVDENQVFGIRHEGLPFPPRELLSKGYSIIHSIKNDRSCSEQEVRDFFAALRRPKLRAAS
ncbi:MAG: hypothetical protein NZ561_09115 [Phycisphaerae bacterium]|nr:hypothetical protein [Phycisphaerae bacterium]MDW8261267.1 hypothetical protein [Phycisphaerales bacterium]